MNRLRIDETMPARISRRAFMSAAVAAGVAYGHRVVAATTETGTVEQWGRYEVALRAPDPANLTGAVKGPVAVFEREGARFVVPAFWDGDGAWRVRFMPPSAGRWAWRVDGAPGRWEAREGHLQVEPPGPGNDGPVQVSETYHFAYADRKPFRALGSTSYLWIYEDEAPAAQTLQSLSASPFNKLRMLILPHEMTKSAGPLPFVRAGDGLDFDRLDPAFFRMLDLRIAQLQEIGIEADIILFHAYDARRGPIRMTPAQREAFVRYIVTRLAGYRNVWWSLANEWDLIEGMSEAEFDRLFEVVQEADPYGHLRSIHNYRSLYDHRRPWITHASIQNGAAAEDDARALLYRDAYRKPVVFDEVRYEGDIDQRWGNLSAHDMVSACWNLIVAGCYPGHGESYKPQMWISGGGTLRGESAPRLAFLRRVMDEGPVPGIDPIDRWWGRHVAGKPGHYYLRYFGTDSPSEWRIDLPKDGLSGGERFRADVLDTWNMTVAPVEGVFTLAQTGPYTFGDSARPAIELPRCPWMAVRMVRMKD